MTHSTLLVAILAMAVVTAFCRVIPFLLSPKSRLLTLLSSDHPATKIIGPALLVALAVVTLTQPILERPNWSTLIPYGVGGLITTCVLRWSGSVGLAVVVAIVGFGLTEYCLSLLVPYNSV